MYYLVISSRRLSFVTLAVSVCGIIPTRILEWVAMPYSRRSSQPRDQTYVSYISGGFFPAEPLGKPFNPLQLLSLQILSHFCQERSSTWHLSPFDTVFILCFPDNNTQASQVVLGVKSSRANVGDVRDMGSVPRLERSPGVNDTPLQYSSCNNPMDREVWWSAAVREVTESQTRLSVSALRLF